MKVHVARITKSTPQLADELAALSLQLGPRSIPRRDAAWLQCVLDQPRTYVLVAFDGSRPVGMLVMASFATVTGYKTWIEDVVVDTLSRRRGVGAKLMLAALAAARLDKIASVNLSCRPNRSEANRLYRRLGFQVNHTNYYRYHLDEFQAPFGSS